MISLLWIAIIVIAVLVILAYFFLRSFLWLAVNSLIGLFALMGWNVLFTPVAINFWSVALVALFGIVGLIVVVLLHFFGYAPFGIHF